LDLQPLAADLKAMHRLYSGVGRVGIIVGHKAETLRQVGLLIDEHLGRKDIAEGKKRRREICVNELLR